VVDARLGGLDQAGLIAAKEAGVPPTLDGDRADEVHGWGDARLEKIGFRVTKAPRERDPGKWRIAYARLIEPDGAEGDGASAREWRVEEWVGEPTDRTDLAFAARRQFLSDHQRMAARWAETIGARLGLEGSEIAMLGAAAAIHDSGKARRNWQAYAGNSGFARDPVNHTALAKFTTRANPAILRMGEETYRHEFGSLRDVIGQSGLQQITDPDLRELALHLIVAHHGNGRPVIAPADQDAPPAVSLELARQVALRFARLQRRWGPWGLAWWEALLRAADVGASREHDQTGTS
jgi:CRISPR-associated endonuclease/helicase Cas3